SGHGKPAIPPQNPGCLSSTQIPGQSAPPFIGSQSSVGSSTQVYPLAHITAAIPPHAFGCGQVGMTTLHCPFVHTACGHAEDPSAQVLQRAIIDGQSPSALHCGLGVNSHVPGQSAPPVAGSHESPATSTHVYPSGHVWPATPPHARAGTGVACSP